MGKLLFLFSFSCGTILLISVVHVPVQYMYHECKGIINYSRTCTCMLFAYVYIYLYMYMGVIRR